MNLLTSVALGWIGRRFNELGGLATFLFSVYMVLPAEYQQLVVAVLTGQGGVQSIGAYAGLAWWLWTQRRSWLATVRPGIVTPAGKKVELDQLPPAAQHDVLVTASQAKPRRTIASAVLDGLIEKLNRNR